MSVVNQCDIRPKARGKPLFVNIYVLVHLLVGALDGCLSRTGNGCFHDTEIIVIIYSPGSPD